MAAFHYGIHTFKLENAHVLDYGEYKDIADEQPSTCI